MVNPFASITPELLERLTPTAWIVANGFVNENQQPIEFTKHRFLIEPFDDMHPDIVVKKSAQIGFSVLAILKSFWLAKEKKINTIYVLPTQDIVKSFVQPKIDPLIASNPGIAKLVSKDSVTLKQIGTRFIHYKGSSSQREAISTTADLLVIDEYDRCIDMSVLNTYDSRLQASDYAWRWRFSNPSAVGFGVDLLYEQSDQRHWFVRCRQCNHYWYIDFEKGDSNHYVDPVRQVYACGKCDGELSDADRQNGAWVAKYPGRPRHGYWFSQMMAPWVSAKRILEQKEESSTEFFYNFVLGKAYTPSDLVVNRETILRACSPGIIPKTAVAIGVDQNANEQIYVCMTAQGVFDYGKVKSWEDIEHLKLMYNATVVCDPAPYPTHPKIYAEKYHDWYICYFKELTGLDVIQWKDNSVVYADRTKLLDTVATEITQAKLLFRQRPYELEAYIADWQNIYRTTVEQPDGRTKSTWLKKDGKNSDFSFATCLDKDTLIFTGNGNIPIANVKVGDTVLTRNGYKPVTGAGITGIKEVVRAEFNDGTSIIATPTHRFYTENRGFVELQHLTPDDTLNVCKSERNMPTFKARSTQDTQTQRSETTVSTLPVLPNPSTCSTKQSGATTMALFQRDTLSTIKITTPLITTPRTSSALPGQSIKDTTPSTILLTSPQRNVRNGSNGVSTAPKPSLNQLPGSTAWQARLTTLTLTNGEDYRRSGSSLVPVVTSHTKPSGEVTTVSALAPVGITSICKNEKRLNRLVPLKGSRPVYNLSVQGKPEYYANGILVHNCYARVGISKMLGSMEGFLLEPEPLHKPRVTDTANPDQTVQLETLSNAVADTLADMG